MTLGDTMKTVLTILTALSLYVVGANAETYRYDDAGRLVSVRYDNGLETTYSYDNNGNLIKSATAVANTVTSDAQLRQISVSPNPASTHVTITGLPDGQARVSVASMLGTTLQSSLVQIVDGSAGLDVRNLTTGVYAISFTISKHIITTTVVIL